MNKIILAVSLGAMLVSGCGSTPTKSSSYALPKSAQFSQPEVSMRLTQTINADGYPDQAQLAKLLQDAIAAQLKANGQLVEGGSTDSLSLKVDIDYERHFAGEATPIPSKSVAPPVYSYTLKIFDRDVEKYSKTFSSMTINRGFGANLLTVATMGLGKTAKDEEKDIQTLAKGIASDLKQLER